MPRPAVPLAPGPIPSPLTEPHLVTMAGEWALWRDIAVRTAGFPVSGLDIFGSRDEQAALRAVARNPLFQTAVTWQNRAAMRNAVAKIATDYMNVIFHRDNDGFSILHDWFKDALLEKLGWTKYWCAC